MGTAGEQVAKPEEPGAGRKLRAAKRLNRCALPGHYKTGIEPRTRRRIPWRSPIARLPMQFEPGCVPEARETWTSIDRSYLVAMPRRFG